MKQGTVEKFTKEAVSAVGIVRSMIDRLKGINQKIEAEEKQNDTRITELQYENHSLNQLKADNLTIIQNFEELLGQ